MHIQELGKAWLRTEDFLKRKIVSMKSIHDLDDLFSDKSLCLSINRPCLLPEMFVFTFIRKHRVICAVDFTCTRRLVDI